MTVCKESWLLIVLALVLLVGDLPAVAPHAVEQAQLERMAEAYQLRVRQQGRLAALVLPTGKLIPYAVTGERGANPWDVADIRGIFRDAYPLTNVRYGLQNRGTDPGRYRNYSLFKAVYGANAAQVRRFLVQVDFCGTKVLFSSKNGAAAALAKVSAEIRQDPALRAWVERLVRRDRYAIGTWNWRNIAGTTNLSAHAFGIAIDILDRFSDRYTYWRQTSKNAQTASAWPRFIAHEKIWMPPAGIVACFERHGFIWGGKWYHFDPMHFEYRPEFFPGGI